MKDTVACAEVFDGAAAGSQEVAMVQPVYRFAPSPTGLMHLGNVHSALLNERLAQRSGGRLLLRIEDIDRERCTATNIAATVADLRWLRVPFEEPFLYQSSRLVAYREAIARLMDLGLLYVCTCTRKTLTLAKMQAVDPEGQPLYPGTCRDVAHTLLADSALRLRMAEAVRMARNRAGAITWKEKGMIVAANPEAWGDVILARKGIGTSYHLSVVVDDAFQGVTHIVRGEDLLQATAIHRVLQILLGLPEPDYHHHPLIRHVTGRKLSKSEGDESFAALRTSGATPYNIRKLLGFA